MNQKLMGLVLLVNCCGVLFAKDRVPNVALSPRVPLSPRTLAALVGGSSSDDESAGQKSPRREGVRAPRKAFTCILARDVREVKSVTLPEALVEKIRDWLFDGDPDGVLTLAATDLEKEDLDLSAIGTVVERLRKALNPEKIKEIDAIVGRFSA